MRYTGKLFHPHGTRLTLDPAGLSPIQGRNAYDLYGQLKRAMTADEFDAKIEAQYRHEPFYLCFRKVGQTAAYVAFIRGHTAEPEALEAAVAILPRLDRTEDEEALEELKDSPALDGIDKGDWENARGEPGPLTAAFFANQESLNDPLIHGMMNLVGAAFLDSLGMLD